MIRIVELLVLLSPKTLFTSLILLWES